MKAFAKMLMSVRAEAKPDYQVRAVSSYLSKLSEPDLSQALFFLNGGRLKKLAMADSLHKWGLEMSGCPGWLFDECAALSGDMCETVALLIQGSGKRAYSLSECVAGIESWRSLDEISLGERVKEAWRQLGPDECIVFNRLLSGALRISLDKFILARAISQVSGVSEERLRLRLDEGIDDGEGAYAKLVSPEGLACDNLCPYPFLTSREIGSADEIPGMLSDWHIEWQHDGHVSQVIVKDNRLAVWTLEGECITVKLLPSLRDELIGLPGPVVLEGVIAEHPATRQEIFVARDILETEAGQAWKEPLAVRRRRLERYLEDISGLRFVRLSAPLSCSDISELLALREGARSAGACGVFLRHRDSSFAPTPEAPQWLTWPSSPFRLKGVLLYAEKGAALDGEYEEFTFGIWDGDRLIPFAKTGSGLSADELKGITDFIETHRRESFGPVRSVEPKLVCDIVFDGLSVSGRRKCGFTLRNPRIARRCPEAEIWDAASLGDLQKCATGGFGVVAVPVI